MDLWPKNRGTVCEDSFIDDLGAAGVSIERWDVIAPSIEEVLNGVDDEVMDIEYPVLAGGLRMFLTEATAEVPPLRVAFRTESASPGTVHYVAVALRSPAG